MKPIRLVPEALAELSDAAAWYESQSPGLAQQFLQSFETVLPLIEFTAFVIPKTADRPFGAEYSSRIVASFSVRGGFLSVTLRDPDSSSGAFEASARLLAWKDW